MKHTAALAKCRQSWEEKGYRTFLEDQNYFSLRGRVATLSGKPDLIAIKNNIGTIIDIKTGSERSSHSFQVMLYMYAIPQALNQYRGITFNGEIEYNNHSISIPESAIDEEFRTNTVQLIRRLASETPAQKIPSFQECRFCDITSTDCPERVENDDSEGTTIDF